MSFFKHLKNCSIFLTVCLVMATSTAFAKSINLYDQPKLDAKVVGTVDAASSLVAIFSNQSGDWMEVGNPKNGQVGWIHLSDMTDTKPGSSSSGFTMTEQTINTAHGPKTYRTIQFGAPAQIDNSKAQAIVKDMQAQQAEIQKHTQKMMQDLYKDMNTLYQAYPTSFNAANYPMFIPVFVIPGQTPAANKTTPPGAPTATPPASKTAS